MYPWYVHTDDVSIKKCPTGQRVSAKKYEDASVNALQYRFSGVKLVVALV